MITKRIDEEETNNRLKSGEITIEEMKNMRFDLEQDIRNMLIEFAEKTSIQIKDVEFFYENYHVRLELFV